MHSPEYIREISPEMKDFLCENGDVITKITIAAENPTSQYIPDFVKSGIIVSIGHSNATYETTKEAFRKGATFATHLHNAMSPISSGRAMGVVGAVLDSDVYTGIIIDGVHVNYGNIKIDKKSKVINYVSSPILLPQQEQVLSWKVLPLKGKPFM
ncbi:N-acetylglucosamine-6-phosphate deacetylase [Rodentibacter pneumotropicus]|uniref:N-acetylglucosamine-6-phosphate deacetylase n=1 Tax=Rodentibacter pneumotropicus TaxID=758 RepID=A0A3S4U958_9PAST|nr:N-acetylglucosamine-6-phosphate deacetylase [Rodentibacter pneumotropicus]